MIKMHKHTDVWVLVCQNYWESGLRWKLVGVRGLKRRCGVTKSCGVLRAFTVSISLAV